MAKKAYWLKVQVGLAIYHFFPYEIIWNSVLLSSLFVCLFLCECSKAHFYNFNTFCLMLWSLDSVELCFENLLTCPVLNACATTGRSVVRRKCSAPWCHLVHIFYGCHYYHYLPGLYTVYLNPTEICLTWRDGGKHCFSFASRDSVILPT